MIVALALLAGASLSFLPLSIFVCRIVIAPASDARMPRLPPGSLDHGELR